MDASPCASGLVCPWFGTARPSAPSAHTTQSETVGAVRGG